MALRPLLQEELGRFPGAEHERFRAGMYAWVEEALLVEGLQLPTFEQMENAKESEMGQLHINRGLRWREEWREEGRQEGMQEGERNLLVKQAGQRFGRSASERLADASTAIPVQRCWARPVPCSSRAKTPKSSSSGWIATATEPPVRVGHRVAHLTSVAENNDQRSPTWGSSTTSIWSPADAPVVE